MNLESKQMYFAGLLEDELDELDEPDELDELDDELTPI